MTRLRFLGQALALALVGTLQLLRVLAVYVGSMKKHLKVMRKAKAVTNGLPWVVIDGNNGSNKARAAHLLAQLERFFEHWHYGGRCFHGERIHGPIPAPNGRGHL